MASSETARLTAAEQLERAESSLEEMQSTLTDRHPDVVTLKQTIAELRNAEADSARQVESATVNAADQLRQSRVEELRAELAGVERQIARKRPRKSGFALFFSAISSASKTRRRAKRSWRR